MTIYNFNKDFFESEGVWYIQSFFFACLMDELNGTNRFIHCHMQGYFKDLHGWGWTEFALIHNTIPPLVQSQVKYHGYGITITLLNWFQNLGPHSSCGWAISKLKVGIVAYFFGFLAHGLQVGGDRPWMWYEVPDVIMYTWKESSLETCHIGSVFPSTLTCQMTNTQSSMKTKEKYIVRTNHKHLPGASPRAAWAWSGPNLLATTKIVFSLDKVVIVIPHVSSTLKIVKVSNEALQHVCCIYLNNSSFSWTRSQKRVFILSRSRLALCHAVL